jgi:glucosamine-6-phosphate deaminase
VNDQVRYFQIESMNVEVHPNGSAVGAAAAEAAARAIRAGLEDAGIGVVFATGRSQLETLRALVAMKDVPWEDVRAFHLDEYVELHPEHAASFRYFLHEHLMRHVAMKEFCAIEGDGEDLGEICREYAEKLRRGNPQLALLGIGENGHLAFNDPGEADFVDPLDVKVVELDTMCRQQQVAEGWFPTLSDVPRSAITLTIPAILRIPTLIVSVPGWRKAQIVPQALYGPITAECPASILRTHPNATLYLDSESASELEAA